MAQHALDIDPMINVSIEHEPNKVDARLAEDKRDTESVVHNLIDAVKGILFVDDRIQ